MGQLYVEFLRYANSDKGLGIVLTPPHICSFFSKVAQINKNSVVYDNCCGTGSFLVNALSHMVKDAKGDANKISQIKSNQLIGTEFQSHIYSLAISNMFIHQDGKTSIFNGSCFDEKIIDDVKKRNPNIGFLNPPYKADKEDTEELEFVLNSLNCLSDGGTCIAIVTMACAIQNTERIMQLKKQLLEKHTLEAVFSMPGELFNDSNASVVTCVMVFTAHRAHNENKKTFLGYFRDDGFTKVKNIGRVDNSGSWEGIESKWLSAYFNREEIKKLSVNKKLVHDDEWCAEAYLETDYSSLDEAEFKETIKQFVMYKYLNETDD